MKSATERQLPRARGQDLELIAGIFGVRRRWWFEPDAFIRVRVRYAIRVLRKPIRYRYPWHERVLRFILGIHQGPGPMQ